MKRKNVVLNPIKKDRKKKLRSFIQFVIVIILTIIVIRTVFLLNHKEEVAVDLTNHDGFIALSYFGISRGESPKYVSKENLEKQLQVLASQGYKTISQQDIIDFYQTGKPLPEKALYLSFEDGRTDSSIFSQKILERLNYQATMFTYANKMDAKDTKFLKPKDLLLMKNSGYWEVGSNGYRLTYINVFNDKGESLRVIDENDVPNKTTIEYYNHYLMDFIRNEFMISAETRAEMEARITKDYRLMKDIYTEKLAEVPKAYAIMHANALYHNMDRLVEDVNAKQLKKIFQMNFNKESNAYNTSNEDIYNLSRLQISPYWSTNHVMMKIKEDTDNEVEFDIGDKNLAKDWNIYSGAAEFKNNEIIVTSNPAKEGRIFLKHSLPSKYTLNFTFTGNVVGRQSVYIKYDEQTRSFIRISLKDNEIIITEKLPDEKMKVLERIPLKEIKWNEEEYAFNKATVYSYQDTQKGSRIDKDEYPRNLKKNRVFHISMNKDTATIKVDNEFSKKIKVNSSLTGQQIGFGALYSKKDTSHEQYADDIYDTIIKDLLIQDHNEQTIFINQYTSYEKVWYKISTWFNKIVDYFIITF